MTIPPFRSVLASSLTVLVIAASTTACGSDGNADEDPADDTRTSESEPTEDATSADPGDEPAAGAGTLTADQVELAVITLDNLGEGWSRDPDDEDEDDDEAPGCLGEIGRLTRSLDKVEEAEVGYSFGPNGLPQVNSGVKTYADEAALSDLFDQFQDEISTCTDASFEEDGTSAELTLSVVADLPNVSVDDQTNMVAAGQLTTDSGQTAPIFIYFSYLRVGASIGVVGTTSLSELPAEHQAWATIGADRLSAVSSGQAPAPTTGPALQP